MTDFNRKVHNIRDIKSFKRSYSMRNQNGFTLIELVVVIVILGVLSAIAVPKFIDIQDDSKNAAVKGARGSVASAMALAHAKSLLEGDDQTSGSTTVTMGGVSVTMAYGYPTADAAGIGLAATLGTDFDLTAIASTTPPEVAITRAAETAGSGVYSFGYREAASATSPAAVSTVVTGTTYTY